MKPAALPLLRCQLMQSGQPGFRFLPTPQASRIGFREILIIADVDIAHSLHDPKPATHSGLLQPKLHMLQGSKPSTGW